MAHQLATGTRNGSSQNRRVTLTEIAQAAGVSPTTVSNVVNGKFELMAAETRGVIERLIAEMNYRPHAAGRNLRLNQQHAIGLLVVDKSPLYLADPFVTHVVTGLSNYLNTEGFSLSISGLAAEEIDDSVLLRKHDTDALCVLASGSRRQRQFLMERLRFAQQPLLLFQEKLPADQPDAASVRQNDYQGGKMVAKRLCERGARSLAMLLPSVEWPALVERQRGVRAALRGVEGASLAAVSATGERFEDAMAALAAWVERHGQPDAVIGGNDQMGLAAIQWARQKGVRVPEEMKVTGFNAFEFLQYSTPALTSVRSPAYELGERGGALLLERLRTGEFSRRDTVFDVELVPGQSD